MHTCVIQQMSWPTYQSSVSTAVSTKYVVWQDFDVHSKWYLNNHWLIAQTHYNQKNEKVKQNKKKQTMQLTQCYQLRCQCVCVCVSQIDLRNASTTSWHPRHGNSGYTLGFHLSLQMMHHVPPYNTSNNNNKNKKTSHHEMLYTKMIFDANCSVKFLVWSATLTILVSVVRAKFSLFPKLNGKALTK